ncbi:MAG: peptidyl-prolyl cis-trans isomerase [Candidatus Woesearchaeota archaeon]|nr:MAG: peptidyl-prolyl cis-trans isomerase [Candidatus Woesearchaeota archaeon]
MIQKGDFIEIDFTARVKSSGVVFDTTIESEAKKHNIYVKDYVFKPMIVCVGEGQLVKQLDDFLIGKKLGKYSVDIPDAFGKKDAKLLRLISIKEFHKHNIDPIPGLEVELDSHRGVVRTVNGGRVIVDFNHPLASQEIVYDIDIKRIVEDDSEKIKGILDFLKFPYKNVEIDNNQAIIYTDIDLEMNQLISEEIQRLTKIKEITFRKDKKEKENITSKEKDSEKNNA